MKEGTRKLEEDKVLTKRQVAAILYGAQMMKRDPECPAGPWAFDAFLLMYVLGLRIGEVIRLRYVNVGVRNSGGMICSVRVPTEKKVLFIRGAKGERPTSKGIDPLKALFEVPILDHNEWVAKAFDPRTRHGKAAVSEWLFPSSQKEGHHVTDRSVDYAFREARDRGGVPAVFSSHCLRHTAATEIAGARRRRGDDKEESKAWARVFLRHSKKAFSRGGDVTDTYIHLGPRNLEDWAPMMRCGVLKLPSPLAPCGPDRFDAALRFGRRRPATPGRA